MPATRPEDLPDYDQPPVTEVALSIQFGALKFTNLHAGLLWQVFKDVYPKVEEKPTINPVFETFGAPSPAGPPELQLLAVPPPNRYWFISEDENELLQIQPDRVIHNWRKQRPEDEYPRYEPLKERFLKEVEATRAFFKEYEIGDIAPNQCEVTYINNLLIEEGVSPNDQIEEMLTVWSENYSDDYLKRIENAQLITRYLLLGADDIPCGRLHVNARPAIHTPTSQQVVQMTITARGKPDSETIESASEWLDKGREAVVRGFTSLTTPAMHKIWKRTNLWPRRNWRNTCQNVTWILCRVDNRMLPGRIPAMTNFSGLRTFAGTTKQC